MKRKRPKKSNKCIINLDLHRNQRKIFLSQARFRVFVCGRRFGKSQLQLREGVLEALDFPSLMPGYQIDPTAPPIILFAMPTLVQARRIFWRPLMAMLEDNPAVERIDKSDFSIEFKGNRPPILVRGLNDSDGDRVRGLKIWRAKLDEIQDIKRPIFDTVIRPAMADTPNSRGSFSGTPKGKLNILYDLYKMEDGHPEWKSFKFATADNPFIPATEIEEARRTTAPRLFRQEYYADFLDFVGKIYSEFSDSHSVNEIPVNFDFVWIGHDPGDVNPAIVVVGQKDDRYYVIEDWRGGDGVNPVPSSVVEDKVAELCKRWNAFRVFCDPARPSVVMDFRSRGRREQIRAMIKCVTGYNSIQEGLNIINNLFYCNELLINSRLTLLIDEIHSYQRAEDRNGNITEKVKDGQKDHVLDALRYILATLHQGRRKQRGNTSS